MSRSGYQYDYEDQYLYLYRGQVASAIRGKRGQAFLRDALAALDSLTKPKLIAGELVKDGEVCLLGAVGLYRGVDVQQLAEQWDPEDVAEPAAEVLNIAECLAREAEYINDEAWFGAPETPEQRWQRVRGWVLSHIEEST